MKQLIRKLRSHFGGVNALILILYTTLVVTVQAFQNSNGSAIRFAAVSLGALVVSAILGPVLLRFLSRCNVSPRKQQQKPPVLRQILVNGFIYLIPLAVFAVYFIACFPGGWSDDSFNQYIQATENQYNDWHPVLHTLLAFKLPLILTGGWVGSVVLFQSLCFSGVIGYACQVIKKHFGIWPAVVTMAYTLLNPLVMLTSMHPWKDVGFAICALLLITYGLQTVVTKGQWLTKPLNMACFVVVAVLATILRHNGILFTAPVILGMALCLSGKRGLVLCLSVLLLFVGIKGPVYSVMKVEAPQRRQVETLGLPMAIIGAVATESPEGLDEQTRIFVEQIAPREVWEAEYELGSFNSIKYADGANIDVIETYGTGNVLSMMLRCIKADPATAARSAIVLTGRLFCLKDAATGFVYPRVAGVHPDIKQAPNMTLIKLCKTYAQATGRYLSSVFMTLGIAHLILILFILAKLNLKRRMDWTKLLVVLGVLCYNFGSGLMLSAWDDIFRFFFYTFPLIPVLLMMLCCNAEGSSKPLFARRKK